MAGKVIGVVGASHAPGNLYGEALEVGRLAAMRGLTVLTGGLGGVMEAACRGAKEAGGRTIGILPGYDKEDANPYVDTAIATGMGHARNVIVAGTSDALIAVGGEYGTLSEVAVALKLGKPVVVLGSWDLGRGVINAANPAEAVEVAISELTRHGKG